jgi:phage baseplate assembly protein W
MAVTRVSRSFKDISLSFEPHPVTKDLPVLTNRNAIIRSVRNLVETIRTERFFQSNLGSDVRDSLFEIMDYATATILREQILEVITNYEPRVENIDVEVEPNIDENNFEVTIIFDIIGQEIPTQSFTFILEATR